MDRFIQRLWCWLGWHDLDTRAVGGMNGSLVHEVFCRECGIGLKS